MLINNDDWRKSMTKQSNKMHMVIIAVSFATVVLAFDTNVSHSLISTDLPGYDEMAGWFLSLSKSITCISVAFVVSKTLEQILLN